MDVQLGTTTLNPLLQGSLAGTIDYTVALGVGGVGAFVLVGIQAIGRTVFESSRTATSEAVTSNGSKAFLIT